MHHRPEVDPTLSVVWWREDDAFLEIGQKVGEGVALVVYHVCPDLVRSYCTTKLLVRKMLQ